MSYATEFPDFPASDIPTDIPPDFMDSSWHNDECPSFTSDARGLTLWVNYPDLDPADHGSRFSVVLSTETYLNSAGYWSFDSDSWADTLAEINRHPVQDLPR